MIQQTFYSLVKKTPLEKAIKISEQAGCSVWLKREDLQDVHSFKIRGAYNKMLSLTDSEKKKGVIAASAGNHAQGVALSAKILGISALIVMPTTTPSIKIDAVRGYNAEVVLYGDSYSDAYVYSLDLARKNNRVFIHPFDDPVVITGQGTVGVELLEQNSDITHVFVPIGGGGLAAGIAQTIKKVRPEIKIIGVEPEDSCAMEQSIKAGKVVELASVGIFSDGVAVKKVGENTFKICQELLDDVVLVDNDQICAAIKSIFEDTRSIVEPAGALSVAAIQEYNLPENSVAVAICSGANMTFEKLQYIAERTMLGGGKEALYAVSLPEKSGSVLDFCEKVINGHNITEFNYRLNSRDQANIFVGVSITDRKDKERFEDKLVEFNYGFADMTHDDVAKEHIRHMIGGPSTETENEHVYSINFPERAGALVGFLSKIAGQFNISLFHYRGQGGDVGRVLIGFEASDKLALEAKIKDTNFDYEDVTNYPSVKLFTL